METKGIFKRQVEAPSGMMAREAGVEQVDEDNAAMSAREFSNMIALGGARTLAERVTEHIAREAGDLPQQI